MRNQLLVILTVITLTGCTVSRDNAQHMDGRTAYGCATSGGVTVLGVWNLYDIDNFCRERVAQLERSGQILDVDKDAAMNDVYGQ